MASKCLLMANRTLMAAKRLPLAASSRTLTSNPWTKEGIIKSPFKSVEIPDSNLFEVVWQNIDQWPEKTMSVDIEDPHSENTVAKKWQDFASHTGSLFQHHGVCGLTGRGYTYSQGYKISTTFAANLRRKLGVRDGDTVAVMLPNIPEYPLVALGALGSGAIISSINPMYTAHEVQRQLVLSGPKIIVTLPEVVDVVKNALKLAKINMPVIVVRIDDSAKPDGTIDFKELGEDANVDLSCLKEVNRSGKDVSFLPYSSGTTGVPKGVELTNTNLVANIIQLNDPELKLSNDSSATYQDVVMAVLPFFHIYGAEVIMFHKLSIGMKLVTLAKVQPEVFLNAMESYKTNVLFTAPPLVLLMASHPAATQKTLQHLEIIINGAAPLAASDVDRFLDKAKRKLDFIQGYGLTETSPVVTMTPKGMDNYAAVGYPVLKTDLKIVDDKLRPVGPNEKGELLVRGPQVMKGYKDNAKANKEAFTEDGWFRTGDLAVAANDGMVTIADRLKELIKVKGFQVPPAELEAVLRDHPSVDDAAVIGVPHKMHGEEPKAFVVLKKGQNVPPEDICGFVKERVAEYKRIYDVTFVDSLPKSTTGKILRRELKEKYT